MKGLDEKTQQQFGRLWSVVRSDLVEFLPAAVASTLEAQDGGPAREAYDPPLEALGNGP